jgi:hypothetical protein
MLKDSFIIAILQDFLTTGKKAGSAHRAGTCHNGQSDIS